MRILPACLYAYEKKLSDADAVKMIHKVAGLTHNHIRGQIACGLYYFCAKSILSGEGSPVEFYRRALTGDLSIMSGI